jgi:alginate O-acetyltransferase complex protein AlgI
MASPPRYHRPSESSKKSAAAVVFNSFSFLVFFAAVFPIYWALPLAWQRRFLLVASYGFYMAWRAKYALLIAGLTALDYGAGLGMGRLQAHPRVRRALLLTSIVANLGLLFVFKYWTFVGEIADWMFGRLQWKTAWPVLDVVIPLGISFHTFQSLSYTVDVYRGKVPVERNLTTFALYVAFFPQLVAGPIERAGHLLPQFQSRRPFRAEDLVAGLRLVALGLFKKMAVADNLAPLVDGAYSLRGPLDAPTLVVATYAYAFQIYADFSGYSDIARGIAQMLGFELVRNFDTPYFSTSVTEFWRRWHISLSSWLRDYLYIPLGGNRHGPARTYANLMTTMLLGGLWHGASWSFVVWGALNGLYLSADKVWNGLAGRMWPGRGPPSLWRRAAGALLTFHLICFSWIFFRAPDLARAWAIATAIGRSAGSRELLGAAARVTLLHLAVEWRVLLWLVALLVSVDLWAGSGDSIERWHRLPFPLRYAGYSALVLGTLAFGVFRATRFIYFQF